VFVHFLVIFFQFIKEDSTQHSIQRFLKPILIFLRIRSYKYFLETLEQNSQAVQQKIQK